MPVEERYGLVIPIFTLGRVRMELDGSETGSNSRLLLTGPLAEVQRVLVELQEALDDAIAKAQKRASQP